MIAGSLQAALPLVSALEQVANPNIKLLSLVQIRPREILWTEEWDELRIHAQSWIGTQVCGNLLSLILKDESARSQQRVVMGQSQQD